MNIAALPNELTYCVERRSVKQAMSAKVIGSININLWQGSEVGVALCTLAEGPMRVRPHPSDAFRKA